ncbi:hypothetical protein ACPDHQ_07330, partial [Myroides odoratimimus]|uniref:hypothetical protein n=1 Tax=Myroides odoratimimus TaxID=76832 RepID=UPI003D2F8C1E
WWSLSTGMTWSLLTELGGQFHWILQMEKGFTLEQHPVLRYCALFINEEKEDRRIINDQMIQSKINDWQEGGVDMNSFFLLLLSLVKGGKEEFKKYIQNTSSQNQKN